MGEHAWTLAEVAVTTGDGQRSLQDWQPDPAETRVLAVACGYCAAPLGFEEAASGRPADVVVHPAHDCPSLPPEPEPEPDPDVPVEG